MLIMYIYYVCFKIRVTGIVGWFHTGSTARQREPRKKILVVDTCDVIFLDRLASGCFHCRVNCNVHLHLFPTILRLFTFCLSCFALSMFNIVPFPGLHQTINRQRKALLSWNDRFFMNFWLRRTKIMTLSYGALPLWNGSTLKWRNSASQVRCSFQCNKQNYICTIKQNGLIDMSVQTSEVNSIYFQVMKSTRFCSILTHLQWSLFGFLIRDLSM